MNLGSLVCWRYFHQRNDEDDRDEGEFHRSLGEDASRAMSI